MKIVPENDYSEAIEVRSTIEHIRRRPAMYFGSTDSKGVLHLVSEVFSNSIDQFLAGQVSEIQIGVQHEVITVADDGPGLPFDQQLSASKSLAECYLTEFRNSPTADGHAPHVHLNGFGLGLAAVTPVCQSFEIRSWCSGKLWTQVFHEGIPSSRPQVAAVGIGRGTTVSFVVDPKVFTAQLPEAHALRREIFEAAHLIAGLRVHLNGETFYSAQGLGDLAALYNGPEDGGARCVFALRTSLRNVDINVGLAGSRCSESRQFLRSWANGSPTGHHGSHVDGLKKALRACKFKPAVSMIHVVLRDPEFAGPTKARLANEMVVSAVEEAVVPPLKQWLAQRKSLV
jgi:DNA gyrase subunit B